MKAGIIASIILAAIVVSGCVGDEPPAEVGNDTGSPTPSVAPPAEFNATSGALKGLVVDIEYVPLGGVDLRLAEADVVTRSAQDGSFSFSLVEPGDYKLESSKLGYFSGSQGVTVAAGEVTEGVEVSMTPLPIKEPHKYIDSFNGYITCSIGMFDLLSEECGEGVQNDLGPPVPNPIGDNPNNKIDWKFDLVNVTGLESVFVELDWEPASTAAQQIALNVAHGFKCTPNCEAQRTYCNAFSVYGPPVVQCEILRNVEGSGGYTDFGITDPATQVPWDMTARAWAAPVPAGEMPNIVLEQSFTMYRTEFYDMAKPEGYSATPPQ